MKKLLLGLLGLAFSLASIAQSVPSPEQFLGYKVGTRFTRHHRIVEYVKTVAGARPDMVKVENMEKPMKAENSFWLL